MTADAIRSVRAAQTIDIVERRWVCNVCGCAAVGPLRVLLAIGRTHACTAPR